MRNRGSTVSSPPRSPAWVPLALLSSDAKLGPRGAARRGPFLAWPTKPAFLHLSLGQELPRDPRAVALVIVHFVESMGGIRAAQAFRREARNDVEIFDGVNEEYALPTWSCLPPCCVVHAWASGGRDLYATIAVVLVYGANRALPR